MRNLLLIVILLATPAMANDTRVHPKTKPEATQGVCHTCKCGMKAIECDRYCGSKNMCVIGCASLCSHDKIMRDHGIKKCPAQGNE